MDLLSTLKRCELFYNLPLDVIEQNILPKGQLENIPKGNCLIIPQERLDRFGVIITGKVHITHIFSDGNYSLMSALEPPMVLGADLMCTKSRISPYHAVAATPSQVLYFPVSLLLDSSSIPVTYRLNALSQLLTLISHDNIKKEYRIAILSQKGLRERILTYLTMQASKRKKKTFAIPFSREELASYLCVNRSALSHELSLMQQEGLISFRKNIFTLSGIEFEKAMDVFGL